MGGLQGLRPALSLSPSNVKCMRLCLMVVLEAVRIMQESCGEVNRGDVSALVSAYSELTEVMGLLQSFFLQIFTFPSPNLFPPTSRQDLLSYAFSLIKNAVDDLSFTTSMDLFLASEPIGSDQRALFQKRLKQFLFLLLSRLQEVLTQWMNGGLIHFDVFTANSIVNFHIDSFESKFDNLTRFMIAQRLVSPSLISSWRSEYPVFSRNVVDSVAQQFAHDSSISSFWLESPCLSSSPSFRCIWNVLFSLGADVTESHHFEEEKFDFHVSVLPSEFQWGVELVRLYQPSWQDELNRGTWKLPAGIEDHLSGVSRRVRERGTVFMGLIRPRHCYRYYNATCISSS